MQIISRLNKIIKEKTNEKNIEEINQEKSEDINHVKAEKINIKLYIIRFVLIILLLNTFYIIFGFSNQNGEQSSTVSKKVSITVVDITDKKLNKEEKTKKAYAIEPVIRKMAHFSIYTVVGILLMSLMCTFDSNTKDKFKICIIIGFLYACSDEIHQLFVNERTGQITDVLIDTCGVILGTVIVYILYKFCVLDSNYKIGKEKM